MHMPGKMHRALAVNGIPAGRVGTAEKLYLQAYLDGGFFDRTADDVAGRLPGGAARGAPFDGHGFNFTVRNRYVELRGAEPLAVSTQTILPGKAASGGRTGHTADFHFFA